MNKYKKRAKEQLSNIEKYYTEDNFSDANLSLLEEAQLWKKNPSLYNRNALKQMDYALYAMPRQYEMGIFFYFTQEDLKDKKSRKRILKLLTYLYKNEGSLKRKECPPKYGVIQADRVNSI